MEEFKRDLIDSLATHGFRQVTDSLTTIPDAQILLRRQTFNSNRAVVIVSPAVPPQDFSAYLHQVRNRAAFRCKFFPLFWGLGLQAVVVSPGLAQSNIDPAQCVAKVDNQWAIVQSVFLVDSDSKSFRSGRTWGQMFTGKYQDAIEAALAKHFETQDT